MSEVIKMMKYGEYDMMKPEGKKKCTFKFMPKGKFDMSAVAGNVTRGEKR